MKKENLFLLGFLELRLFTSGTFGGRGNPLLDQRLLESRKPPSQKPLLTHPLGSEGCVLVVDPTSWTSPTSKGPSGGPGQPIRTPLRL